jgi:hypothetical protein
MSTTATFVFGIWSGIVVGVCGVLLVRGMIFARRARKLKELQRYQEAARKPHNSATLEQYLRSSDRDGI